MSAKRLKVEGMNGERAPPSRTRARSLSLLSPQQRQADGLGAAPSSPPPPPGPSNLAMVSSPASSTGETRSGSASGRADNLTRIESALGLLPTFRHPNSLLSFDDFYKLLGKVQLKTIVAVGATTSTAEALISEESTLSQAEKDAELPVLQMSIDTPDLSEGERLLFQLLRVTVPVLYNVCLLTDGEAKQRRRDALFSSSAGRPSNGNEATNFSSTTVPSLKQNGCPRRRYYLEKVGFRGNRIKELRRLIQECEPCTAEDDDILGAIRKHRDVSASTSQPKMSNRNLAVTAGGRIGSDDRAVIRDGMTIDERVRAREQARLKRNEDAARATAEAVEAGDTTMDRAWLVRVADALWRHASDILARQNRAQLSPQRQKRVAFCTLTLRDAVSVLKRALSAPGSNSIDKKTTTSALVDAILELAKLAPKWIQRTGTGDGSAKVLKDDALWIYHSHYQEARALVGGKAPAAKSSPRAHSTAKIGDSASKRPLDTPAVLVPQSHVVTSDGDSATSNLPKKQRLDRQSQDDPPPFRLQEEPREASANEKTPPPGSASKKPPLRINPHLILTDADYTGGEVIIPSFFDSPRGLKILFDNINAGNRI